MKVFYLGVHKENYDPARGESFEYNNFYSTLKRMRGIEVVEFPFDKILVIGKRAWNAELFSAVRKEKPDLLFAFMYTDELEPETLLRIKSETSTKTIAWFADDYWRFFNYSRRYAPYFNFVATTYSRAVEWYRNIGIENVTLSQWASNSPDQNFSVAAKDVDVSFIGQYKSGRERTIRRLERAGIPVEVFGFGWPKGKLTAAEMRHVVNRSKITLNLTDRPGLLSPRVIARIFLRKSINKVVPDFNLIQNFQAYLHVPTPHTHARPFELSGRGAFVITGYSEDIARCYEEDKEMVFYRSLGELVEKVKYYLAHKEVCEAIARAGHTRTLREHTYEARFKELFRQIVPSRRSVDQF